MKTQDTIELTISLKPAEPWGEALIAELSEVGFDSFVNNKDGILAYANDSVDIDQVLKNSIILNSQEVESNVESKVIPYQNWNATWEENFDPVFIEDKCTIVAPFHNDIEIEGLKIEIQPQMSFGTGHHQTTWMMSKMLFDFKDLAPNILDMGTGTGVLAIISEKLGAKNIKAVDIEDWSVENAIENATRNNCQNIECWCGDIESVNGEFGMILANINKNVLKAHIQSYYNLLLSKGFLMMSGFFDTDVNELKEIAEDLGFEFVKKENKDEWAAILLQKK